MLRRAESAARWICFLTAVSLISGAHVVTEFRGPSVVNAAQSSASAIESGSNKDFDLPLNPRSKISADLAPIVFDDASGIEPAATTSQADGGLLRVIVQTKERPAAELVDTFAAAPPLGESGRPINRRTSGLIKARAASSFTAIDGFVAELSPTDIRELANRDDVIYISPDRQTRAMAVDVYLRQETGAKNFSSSIDGSGVTIAFLDSGLDWNNTMLKDSLGYNRVKVVVDAVTGESTFSDVFGHGTAVAGAAAGRSYQSISGIATGADLISVRVLNSNGEGLVSDAIRGIDWCISNRSSYNIRVINMSIGASSVDSFTVDPLCKAVERAVYYGITVVTSAGNQGRTQSGAEVYGSITSPGNDPLVITVGSVNTKGTSYRSDDQVNRFSSRGPTLGYKFDSSGEKQYDFVLKPDLVAPGNQIITARASNSRLIEEYPELAYSSSSLMQLSGTSIASGVVAGAAAVLLEVNPTLTPGIIKAILQYTAQPLSDANICQQGAGLLNIDAAAHLASYLKGATYLDPGDWLCYYSSLPSLYTSISGQTCAPSGVIFCNGNHVWAGSELFLRYQLIYEPGVLWYGKTVSINGNSLWSGTVLTAGVKNVTDAVKNNQGYLDGSVLSSGLTLTQGISLVSGITTSVGIVLSEGKVLIEGETLSQGIVVSEGIALSEGIVISEGVLNAGLNPYAFVGEL